jgi:hypothetical protein
MDERLAQEVRRRAGEACEYCRVAQASYSTVPFPIDHVIARQHEGPTVVGNLALSCLHCNSHKGPNIAGIDPRTKRLTKLFNPRRHKWGRHFRWDGPLVVGRTAIGRVTVAVLAMNAPEAVEVREALIEEGIFPLPEELE